MSTTPSGSTTSDPQVQQLVKTIQSRYADADAALRTGNLKRYAELQDEIRTLVDQLVTLVAAR